MAPKIPEFETKVAEVCHIQWLNRELASMVNACLMSPEQGDYLFPWSGNVYDDLGIDGTRREENDVGIRPKGRELPTVIVQSCWEKSYDQTYREMKDWMYCDAVKRVILLKWTNGVEAPDCDMEMFEYDSNAPDNFRRTMEQKILPPPPSEMKGIKITVGELFGDQIPWADLHPRLAYYMSTSRLGKISLEKFENDMESYDEMVADMAENPQDYEPDTEDSKVATPPVEMEMSDPVDKPDQPAQTSQTNANDEVCLKCESSRCCGKEASQKHLDDTAKPQPPKSKYDAAHAQKLGPFELLGFRINVELEASPSDAADPSFAERKAKLVQTMQWLTTMIGQGGENVSINLPVLPRAAYLTTLPLPAPLRPVTALENNSGDSEQASSKGKEARKHKRESSKKSKSSQSSQSTSSHSKRIKGDCSEGDSAYSASSSDDAKSKPKKQKLQKTTSKER
ncbi:Similar to conserved hypothetical protein [Ajellomyces capsulatus H88]; acc. no. EGC41826 [Pyronema omphalodes CBS 100304]|uniref:Uncharacterized protein n=1 Tax=Pyronema omphalodes (strain CBS 100304) TaxID=1076935 RepID=U4LUA8_PYROM|nr:Similar to conserved hypothetical protein [Ajellomyces capsulatus H88]; acc. no. EGC41826 [Pyronema omphalodes CBS 100304]